MMTNKTVLTKELIDQLADKHLWGHAQFLGSGKVFIEGAEEFACAIEQAILQSEQVQALRKDKERLDWLADPKNNLGKVQLPKVCVLRNLHSLRDAIDDSMGQKK